MPIKYTVNGKGYIIPEEQVQNFLDGVKQQGLKATKVGDDYSKPITSTDGVRLITVGDKGYAVPESQVQRFKEVASSLNKDFVDMTEEHRKSRQKLIDATLQAAEESYQGKNEKSGDRSLAMLKKTIYGWNDNDILDMYETYKGVIDDSTPWGTTLARMRSLAPGKEKMGTDNFNFNRIGHRLFLAFEEMAAAPGIIDAMYRNLTDKPLTSYNKFLLNYISERERLTSEDRGFMESAMASLVESLPAMVLSFTTMGLGTPIKGVGFMTKAWGNAVLKNAAQVGIVHGLTTAPKAFVAETTQYELDKKKLTTGDAVNILLKTGTEVLTETIGDAIFGVTVGKIAAGSVGRKIEKALLDKPVKKMFTDALKVAGANFVTEGFIEEGTNTILNAATDMVTGRPDAWKNFYSNFMEASLLGGVSTLPLSLLGIGGASTNVRGIKRVYNAVNEYANIAEEAIPDLDPAKQAKVILSKRLRAGVEIAKTAQERFDAKEITQAELDAEQTKAADTIGQVITEINVRAELSKMDPRYSFDGELQHMLMIASLTHDTLANSSPAVEKHIEETNARERGRIMSTSESMQTADTPESLTADIETETQRLENPAHQVQPAQPKTVEANQDEGAPVEQPATAIETTGDTELDQIIADNYDDVAIEKINSGQATVEEIEREAVYARKAIRQILSLKEKNPQNKKSYNKAIKSFTSLLGELSAAHNAITGGIVDLAEPLRLEQEQKRQAYNEGKIPKPVKPEPGKPVIAKSATPEKPKRVRVTKAKPSTEPTIDEVPDQKSKAMQDRIAELEARLKAFENPEPTPPAPRKKGKIGKVRIATSDKTSAKDSEPVPDVSKETILERGVEAVGDETFIVTLDNKQAKMRWAIVDLKDLTGSHNADFTENPQYPKGKGYQPKKRDAQNYRIQVAKIVNEFNPSLLMDSTRSREGAPIVVQEDGKNIVLSGNGRVIALNQLSDANSPKLDGYVDYIAENMDALGLDITESELRGMERPTLVRVLSEDAGISPKELADDSNTQDTSALTPYEQAISDAANMTDDMISDLFVDANNDIVTVSNMPFITAFVNQNIPQTEHNTYIPKGVLTVQLVQRIKKALIVKAFGESAETQAIVDQLDSTKPDAKNILGAVVSLTPLMVKINSQINAGNLYPLGMTDELLHATLRSLRLAAEGISYKQYLEQETVFDESGDEFSNELFDFLQTTKGKKSEMLWTMSEHYRVIKEFGNPSEQDIFGYKREATKSDVFAIAKEHYNEAKGKKQTEIDLTGEGTDQGADQNTPPTPQERYRQLSGNPAQPTIEIGQMTDAILSLLPKQTRPTAVIFGNTATITISYRGQPRQIVINSLTGRITDMDGKPIYSGRTSVNRDEGSSIMAIIDIVKNDNEGNMTAYHEGFHLAFALFLSEKEQRTLIEAYSDGKKMADMTQDEIIAAEEKAAKQFEALIRGDMLPAGAQRTLLEKLWDAIKTFVRKLFGNDFAINHLDVLTRIKNADYLSGLGNSKPVFGKRYLVSQENAEAERQLDEVRAKYEGTDQWLKAPNGKPSNLNERQWLQVRTPAFKAWFGDWENDPENASKVVDENGEPMVVYHGTNGEWTEFDQSKGSVGVWGNGLYTTSKKQWGKYGQDMELFLNIRNPVDATSGETPGAYLRSVGIDFNRMWSNDPAVAKEEAQRLSEKHSSDGNDGMKILDSTGMGNVWFIAFTPTQIKSATANVGTFDPQNADIRYQEAVEPRGYKLRTKPAPKKTVTVYKAFRLIDGKLYPMFVGAEDALPVGEWIDATEGGYRFTGKNGRQYVPALTGVSVDIPNAKVAQELFDMGLISSVKTKQVKCVAYRPGWHGGELPFFPQAGTKANNPNYAYPHYHNAETVIAEVEMDADRNYKTEYEETAERNKKGEIIKSLSGLRTIPDGGYYEYPTNPMFDDRPDLGKWYISGSVKINKVLSRAEVNAILDEQNVPRQLWVDEVQSVRYREAPTQDTESDAALSANATLQAIMDSGVEMSARLKSFMVKVINVMSANSGESQKEKLNLLIKSFHKYLKVALPEMGFTKSTVLHITTRFGNIKTIRSFAKEAAALDKMINQAYGKKLYAAILASARSVANDKVALRSTKQPTTDKLAQDQVKYISQVIAMSPEMQSAEYQRLETVDPGTEMSPEESDMLEFKKWAVMLFSGLRLDHVAKDGSVRHSYADPAKIAQAYHELQSLIKNGKTLQAEKMAKITAEFNQTRFKIKAMLLGGSGDLTDFDRQDIEAGRKKSLARWADALHAQLAFMETIFEEADVLGYRNHKSLIAYKAKLEQGLADLALSIEEEPTDKKKLQLIDLKNSMEALDSLIADTATYKGIYKGWFQTTFYDDLYDAKSRFEGGLISYMNGMKEKRKEIAEKVGLDRFWHSYGTAAMNELKYKIDMKDSDGTRRLRTLNLQQIMAVYAQSLNPEMAETLEGTGFDETAMADIDRILDGSKAGKFARLWVEYIVNEFMPVYYSTINAIHVERYGFDLQQEMVYFPIERKYNKDVKMPEPGDYRPVMSESMYVGNTSLIARVNSNLPMNLERSVFDAQLVTHIHNMEHFKAFAMPMYRARMTMLKRDVQQAFIDKLGKQRWDTLTGFYRDQAANGYTQINKTTVSNVANWMMNSSAFIFLNLKPSVGLKQTSSMILMAGYMKPLQAVVNYAWAFKNIDKVWKIIKDSPTFQIRYKQGITAEQHMALQHGNSSTVKSLLRQYVNDYINFGKYGDLVSVLIGGGAYYKQQYDEIRKPLKKMIEKEVDPEAIKQMEKMVEAEAIKQMEKMVERTQQSASILYASRIRRDSMLGRAVTQFQTQFHALYNAIYNRINELRVEGADKGQIAWSLAMLTMLYPMLAAFFDDGLVPPDDPRDVAMGVISQNMAMIPVMGNMIDTMLTAIVTGNYRQDYTRIMPSSSLFEVAFKFMQNANQFVDEPTFRKGFETAARAMILFGIPAYPLWQTTYGMIDFFSGKDKRAGRLFGFSEGQLDMVEKENKANDKRLDKK